MFHTEDVQNIKKHFYGTVSKATNDNITRLMRFACWITTTTDTLKIRYTYCYSTATMVTRTRFCYVIRTLPLFVITVFRFKMYYSSLLDVKVIRVPPTRNFRGLSLCSVTSKNRP